MKQRFWQRVLHDPIFHFAVLGCFLFGLHAMLSPDQKPTIRVDPKIVDALLQERAALMQRTQTAQDRQEVIDGYIADEVLLHEAYRRGLDKSPRIRAQLIQAMRFALSSEPPTPNEPTLRAYFAANRERFARPPTMSLTQVFVRSGQERADDILTKLNSADDPGRLSELDMNHASSLRTATSEDIARVFDRNTAEVVSAIDDNRWHGPYQSPRGTFFIRVDERQPATSPSYEQLASHLADEWTMVRQEEIIERQVAEIARGFTVILPAATTN